MKAYDAMAELVMMKDHDAAMKARADRLAREAKLKSGH